MTPYEYLKEAVKEMSGKLDKTKDAFLIILYTGHGRPEKRDDLKGKPGDSSIRKISFSNGEANSHK